MDADVLVNVHDVENCCRIPAPGMMSTLMYGICILLGQFTAKDELWKTVSLPHDAFMKCLTMLCVPQHSLR